MKKAKGEFSGDRGGKCVFGVYNRRRRLTARSSGKQQAVCTAVRAALMVCPEEGHFVCFQKRKLFCRSNGCSLSGFSPASVSEGFQRVSGKPFDAPAGAYLCWGMTRRLRRGSRAYSPMGRSHFSFGGERKVCKRKPAARRLQRRPAPLRVIRKYRRSGHCRARPLYLLRPVSR